MKAEDLVWIILAIVFIVTVIPWMLPLILLLIALNPQWFEEEEG